MPMSELSNVSFAFLVAAGVGLLIGIERERSKSDGAGAAGVRTFTLVALMGAAGAHLGVPAMLLAGVFVAAAALLAYVRSSNSDPGLTTEIALVMTYLLGVMAKDESLVAGALGVAVAILLAGKSRLHHFAQQMLTPQEIHDGLLLLASALIVLPLLPAGTIDPWGVIEIRKLWTLVVLIMAIGAAGHVALRVFGARIGLPLAGFVGGFVSSAATIAAMGQRAQRQPERVDSAAAAGMASSIATAILLTALLAGTSLALLRVVWPMLAVAALIGVAAAAWLARRAHANGDPAELADGRPFDPRDALMFAALIAAVLLLSAGLKAWLGPKAIWLAAASAGFADVHAAALSMAQLVTGGTLGLSDAKWALVLAFSTNLLTKLAVARRGGAAYYQRILPGHLLMLAAVLLTASLR
ncbi:MAG: DUF4010 domain-containing protein [Lysobacterales bacterium]